MKLYLLLITQDREQDIKELISNIYPVFDGIIACVHQPFNDRTFDILEENKRSGKIVSREFFPFHHAHSMNELLYCRHMKDGDYGVIVDSPERVTDIFLKDLPKLIKYMEQNSIDCAFADGRPYIFRYNYSLQFVNSPHWGLHGFHKGLNLLNKDLYIINKRKEEPWKSWCLNPIKYWFCYHISNETQIMYQKYGQDIVNKHELVRQEFRSKCEKELNICLDDLDDLINFYKSGRYTDWLIETTENEFRLSELFQLKVLNMDFMSDGPNGMHPRFKFSFKHYLKTGEKNQKHLNYDGTIIKYNKQFNINE